MSFNVSSTIYPDYIRLSACGQCSLDQIFEFIAEIKHLAADAARTRVMADIRDVEGAPVGADLFYAGERIAETLGGRIRLAVVSPAERITRLGEMAAVNRGARMFVTANEDEAVHWLLEDAGADSPRDSRHNNDENIL